MSRRWGRLYSGTRNHRKIKILRESLPNLWTYWYVLIEMAIEVNDGGWIYVSEGRPYTDKELAKELGIRREDHMKNLRRTLEELGLVTSSELGVCLKGFRERNYESDISTSRVQKYREKQKVAKKNETDTERFGNVSETHQNRTDTDTDTEVTPIVPLNESAPPPTPPPGEGEIDGKGKKKQTKPSPHSPDFERFWSIYPNATGGKDKAWKIWQRRQKANSLPYIDYLIESVQRLTESPKWLENDGEFIPMVTTFLNGGRWTDADMLKPKKPAQNKAAPNCPYCHGRGLVEAVDADGNAGSALCRCRGGKL